MPSLLRTSEVQHGESTVDRVGGVSSGLSTFPNGLEVRFNCRLDLFLDVDDCRVWNRWDGPREG